MQGTRDQSLVGELRSHMLCGEAKNKYINKHILQFFLKKHNTHSTCMYMHAKLLQSCLKLFVTLWTIAGQTTLSTGFSRQEYWGGCHALLQGIFTVQGSNPHLLHWQADSLPLVTPGKPSTYIVIPTFPQLAC